MVDRKPSPDKRQAPQPSRLGPYSLVSELDAGPLGSRWLGFVVEGADRGRLVAARRIKTGPDVTATTKLDQAARIAMGIRHAKVTAVLDVVKAPGEVAVVSEHMDGEPLSSLLSLSVLGNTPIAPAVALAIVRDVVDATMAVRNAWLRAAQGKDSLLRRSGHGGLQPNSVLVATFGEALLTEPGVAGVAAALPRFAKQASSLPYRAPEQLDPAAVVDERTDVFCAGVILWELLAGSPLFGPADRLRRPTATGSVQELEQELREKPIPSLDTIQRPGAPIHAEVAVLVARALQREPGNRYGGLLELRAAIAALPAGRVASEEQVAATVDRLARSRIEARRAAFEHAVGGRVMDSAPPSSMATDKPAPPSRPLTVVIPGDEWKGDSLAELANFSVTEVPTRSGAPRAPATAGDSLPPTDEDRPTALPVDAVGRARPPAPPPRRGAQGGTAPPEVPPPPAFVATPTSTDAQFVEAFRSAPAMSEAGMALASPPAATPAPRRRQGRTLAFVTIGAALLILLAAVAVSVLRTGASDASADTAAPSLPDSPPTEPPSEPAGPEESPEVPLADAKETPEELVDESVDQQPVEATSRPSSGRLEPNRDRSDEPARPRQPDGKAFRPSGI